MLLVLTNCFVILLLVWNNYCSMLVFAFVVSVSFLKVTDLAYFNTVFQIMPFFLFKEKNSKDLLQTYMLVVTGVVHVIA